MNSYHNYLGEITTNKGEFQAQLRTVLLGFDQMSMGCGSWRGCIYIPRGHDTFDDDKFEFVSVKFDNGETVEASSLKHNDFIRITHVTTMLNCLELKEYPFTPKKD